MKPHTLTTLGAIAIAGILISSSASADEKTYPGAFCQPYFGSQAGDFTTSSRSIKNNTNRARYVSCPIISDNRSKYGGIEVSFRSLSGNTTATTCYTMNYGYAANYQSYGTGSNVSSGASTTMYFNARPRNNTHHQVMYCRLPASTELNWYGVGAYLI